MRNSPVYYGWFVLGASAVSEMLVQGAATYSAGLFVLPLQAEFHISRAAANSAILILFLGIMLVAPLSGRLLDVRPIRLMMSVGAAILALSAIGIATSSSLPVIALILLLPMASAFMVLGPLNTSTLASRWFYRHRGLALGIAAVATSGGGFTVTPILSRAIAQYGWRTALAYEGVVLFVIILALALLVVRDRPADMNLADHPENQGRASAAAAAAGESLRWTEILSTRAFWIPCLTVATISATSQAIVVTLVPYGVQLGMKPVAAALPISVFAIAAAITKIAAGVLSDRVNQRYLLIAAALGMTLSWLTLSFFAVSGALFAGAGLAGVALGLALPSSAALIASSFSSLRFGQVWGWGYALTAALLLVSVLFAGFMFDRFGSYHLAFLIFAAFLAALSLLTLLVTPTAVAARS
jgi:sugar phosphate permease